MLNSRLANVPPCLIGIEAGKGTHYLARELISLGHDARQVPPAYPKPFRQIHKNDFRDAYAIAEAVRRPSTRCVPVKIDDQLDLQALQRVRSRLVGQRTAVINQIRGFLLECGIAVRQGLRFLRQQLPEILAKRIDVLSPRMIRIVEDLSGDWRRLDKTHRAGYRGDRSAGALPKPKPGALSVQVTGRTTLEHVDGIGGISLEKGQSVICLPGSANRDPAAYSDPDRLDITRRDLRPLSSAAVFTIASELNLPALKLGSRFRRFCVIARVYASTTSILPIGGKHLSREA